MSSNENDNNGAVESEPKPTNEYAAALVKEKYQLDTATHPNAMKLLDEGKRN